MLQVNFESAVMLPNPGLILGGGGFDVTVSFLGGESVL